MLRRLERRTGLSTGGMVTLVAVIAVLFVISLPRLRSFARSENERDALDTAALLARELAREPPPGTLPRVEDVAGPLLRRLPDSEFLDEGRALRRHGYVFTLRRVEPPPPADGVVLAAESLPSPPLAIHAWPWRHGHTGAAAFVALPDGRVYLHANPDGRWSGHPAPSSGPWTWDGWRAE